MKALSKRAMKNREEQENTERYLAGLAAAKKGIPQSARRPEKPDLEAICALTGLRRESALRPDNPCRVLIDQHISIYGLEPLIARRHRSFPGEVRLPLAEVLLRIDGKVFAVEIEETYDAVRVKIDALMAELIALSDLGRDGHAIPLCEKLLARKQSQAESTVLVERMLGLSRDYLASPREGDSFCERLEIARGAAGLSRMELARQLDINEGTFNSWCSGAKLPDISKMDAIAALEELLEVDPNFLCAFVKPKQAKKGRVPVNLFPAGIQKTLTNYQRSLILEGMPEDFDRKPDAEKRRLIAERVALLDQDKDSRIAWRALRKKSSEVEVPVQFERQYAALEKFKTTGLIDGVSIRVAPAWSGKTPDIMRKRAYFFCTYLIQSGQVSDPCIADMVNLTYIKNYIAHLVQRQGEAHMPARYTNSHRDLVTFSAALLHEATGFLRLTREHESTLKEILANHQTLDLGATKNALGRADIAQASHDDVCSALRDRLKRFESSLRGKVTPPKEHRQRLAPLLDDPKLVENVASAIERHWNDIQNIENKASRSYHLGVRDAAILRIAFQAALRRGTLCALDHDSGTENNLFLNAAGKYELRIPAKKFKNRKSRRFTDVPFFERVLDDVLKTNEVLHTYLAISRPALLGEKTSTALFVTSAGSRLPTQSADLLINKWSRCYLGISAGAERIEGFKEMTMHGFRHVLATALYNANRSHQEVADVLYDDVDVVKKFYERWLPKHNKARITQLVSGVLTTATKAG